MPSRRRKPGASRRRLSKGRSQGSWLDSLLLGILVALFVVVLRTDPSGSWPFAVIVGVLVLLLWIFWRLYRKRASLKHLKHERGRAEPDLPPSVASQQSFKYK